MTRHYSFFHEASSYLGIYAGRIARQVIQMHLRLSLEIVHVVIAPWLRKIRHSSRPCLSISCSSVLIPIPVRSLREEPGAGSVVEACTRQCEPLLLVVAYLICRASILSQLCFRPPLFVTSLVRMLILLNMLPYSSASCTSLDTSL